MKHCIAGILILVFTLSAMCQTYPVTHYSTKDGLPNSNVYSITQDHQGYMWFGTENGLSRFDGFEFENFGEEDLGNAQFVTNVYNSGDSLLIGIYAKGIYLKKGNKFETIFIDTRGDLTANQLLIKDSLLFVLNTSKDLIVININNKAIFYHSDPFLKDSSDFARYIFKSNSNKIYIGRSKGLFEITTMNNVIHFKKLYNASVSFITETPNNNILFASGNKIYELNNDSLIQIVFLSEYPEVIIRNVIIDKDLFVLHTINPNKLLLFKNNNLMSLSDKLNINNTQINHIFYDKENLFWIGTMGKGIIKIGLKYIYNYDQEFIHNPFITSIAENKNNEIILGTFDGLSIMKKDSFEKFRVSTGSIEYVRSFYQNSPNNLYISIIDTGITKNIYHIKTVKSDNCNLNYIMASSVYQSGEDTLIIGYWKNRLHYAKIYGDSIAYFKTIPLLNGSIKESRITIIMKDFKNQIWCGTQHGLFLIDANGKLSNFNDPILKSNINDIRITKKGIIIIASDKGLSIIEPSGNSKSFKNSNINSLSLCKSAIIDKYDNIWVGTLDGLYFINNGQINRKFTMNDGLISDEINVLYYQPRVNFLYIGTTQGLSVIDLNEFYRDIIIEPVVFLEKFVSNSLTLISPRVVNTTYESNTFSLKFTSFYYSNPHALRFQYKLDNQDWIDTKIREVQFASLSAGHHLVKFRASILPGKWGKETLVKIHVAPPFYQTGWFYLLVGLSVTGLISLFIKKRIEFLAQKHKEQNIIQQKFNEYEQKALASNLNPHFIFNALNSIQLFVNTREINEANNYLSKFSKLIRMHLNLANHSFILMADEMVRLRYYLDLESMRFEDKMSYSIVIDPTLDPDYIEIPNMIIQPFVENAIWHGIMPLSSPGHISVTIQPGEDEILEIRIADNGIGKENSQKFQREMHQSKGIEMINERLRLLDEEQSQVIEFKEHTPSIDLPGTLVIIKLTKKMYNKKVKINLDSFALTR